MTPIVLCSSKSIDKSRHVQVLVTLLETPAKDESYDTSQLAEESTTAFAGDFACGGIQLRH
jgi:hypothetical protein